MTRRVVITGLGVRAPGGNGTKAFWDLLSAGRTATRSISFFYASSFRSRIAGEVDFDAAAEGIGPREVRRMDRATQFAAACTREAVADSGLDLSTLDPHRVGVSLGSAVASATSLENEYLVMSDAGKEWEVAPSYLSPHMFDCLSPGVMPAEVAWEVGAEGPVTMVSDGCTSGLDSRGYAVQLIREGTVDTVVAGAADTPISPIVVACFDAIKATTTRNDDPAHASRPFDGTRNGFVLAEGAAMFVLEEYEAAKKRGAHIYAEVGGYATRCNAHHMTGLRKDGREMAEAIRVSLDEARLDGTRIDYVNAHGSGTKQNDRHETAAFTTFVVVRNTLRCLQAAEGRVRALEERVGDVSVLVINEGPCPAGEVQRVLQVPVIAVIATLPYAPKDARVLSDRAEQPRHFTKSPLMKAARTSSTLLLQRAATRRARLDPRGLHAAGGEVTHAR